MNEEEDRDSGENMEDRVLVFDVSEYEEEGSVIDCVMEMLDG